jgi:hypothetical protein
MIRFQTTRTLRVATGTLAYVEEDLAFDTIPRPVGSGASLLLNDIELMLNEANGSLSFVTGYCPFYDWDPTPLRPPSSHAGVLMPVLNAQLERGVSQRLVATNGDDRWPVSADADSGWVRVGNEGRGEEIHFAPGAHAVLDVNGLLIALWLRPNALPGGFLTTTASRDSN